MSRYPGAIWLPWTYWSPEGQPTYYKGSNRPEAAVLHRLQGYARTAQQWAAEGHYGASWHYTVALDGRVAQHLEHADGGYHAGIPDTAPAPRWALWKGRGLNINHYTIGIECEGFQGGDWPEAQLAALRDLCRWLAGELGIRLDYDHFPPHADIDVVNRVNDFDTPERRTTIVYPYLLEEGGDQVTREEYERLVVSIYGDRSEVAYDWAHRFEAALYRLNRRVDLDEGSGLLPSVAEDTQLNRNALAGHATPTNHPGATPGAVADHTHTPGGVSR